MEYIERRAMALLSRDTDPATQLLELLQDPFNNILQVRSVWSSLAFSVAVCAGIALLFSFIRPYNTVVYAPKLKHADESRAPPPLGKGIFAWIVPLWTTDEKELIRLVGMDAALFLRFLRMCRNMFFVLAVVTCAVVLPTNNSQSGDRDNPDVDWLMKITPRNVFGEIHWVTVCVSYFSTFTVCGFLWWNYRKVLHMRQEYFQSEEYQNSLHSRTLMMYDIPKGMANDEGIARIIDGIAPNSSFSRTAIARNVKILPELIKEHEKTVRKLEEVLAKYLKDPKNLPPSRPVCNPSKKDRSYGTYPKGQKLDAIDYLTQRIKDLEVEIKEVRLSVDKRNTMGYGFASYSDISEAHAIAYAATKKKPLGGAIITLAPRPNDIIWDNMPLNSSTRSRKRFIVTFWIAVLTFLWIAPNAGIAMFLVNLSNLGRLWKAFGDSLANNRTFWSLVQGILNPALTSLIYLVLPIIFRRLMMRAGDQTKSGRERHVVAKLYSFFVFNNLIIFSLFSSLFTFTSSLVQQVNKGTDAGQAILKQKLGHALLISLCNISPFWVTWLLQRQLGAAIDLAQLWPLIYSFFRRKFSSPTPREMIELTAPPPIDYASYYNYFLYYATIALAYAVIQPLVLPAAALYFIIDVALKKYLLLYVFVTKTESGGMVWRVLFNRLVFATILGQLVVFLTVWVRGEGQIEAGTPKTQAYAVAPLPFIMIIFKIYCSKVFDTKIKYYSTKAVTGGDPEAGMPVGKESHRNDRLAARFGHPALYKPLITPMVHAKAQNILASVYQGRLSDGREAGTGDTMSTSGYSDTFNLGPMHAGKPGKSASKMPGFEVVPESKLDFEYYKNRDEFSQEHGGGDIFNTRPGTPSLAGGPDSRPGTPVGGMTGRRQFSAAQGMRPPADPFARSGSPGPVGYSAYSPSSPGPSYPSQQPSPYGMAPTPYGPPSASFDMNRTRSPLYGMGITANESGSNLVGNAAGMPKSRPPAARAASPDMQGSAAPGMLGGGPYGYGNLPQDEVQDPMSYDYFRGANSTRRR
ncbi:hypothetical protein MCOR27_009089 [Pyricularia oryzae]|uniref:DUF221-domain-containing protein n=2 Tax=Pyricularia TaxID=48558 RepID=A0ABQ8NEK6_PYRGI|nr:hypothetical protein MCOR01_001379 [Pyricularia oryzae]KAI6294914.1 hypothetical protein MCOR33_008077 [Pyricularia grisea]KAH9430078.1 hypothetical protein MCOR02_012576 [Pyricularia oryzae]KAI6254875.1 hypothetical protein MCOR19_008635 [Pyricularia oryzae]KAI6270871.1 hypothetical protein MCOR27_009089 [Pyricularia oryzae]